MGAALKRPTSERPHYETAEVLSLLLNGTAVRWDDWPVAVRPAAVCWPVLPSALFLPVLEAAAAGEQVGCPQEAKQLAWLVEQTGMNAGALLAALCGSIAFEERLRATRAHLLDLMLRGEVTATGLPSRRRDAPDYAAERREVPTDFLRKADPPTEAGNVWAQKRRIKEGVEVARYDELRFDRQLVDGLIPGFGAAAPSLSAGASPNPAGQLAPTAPTDTPQHRRGRSFKKDDQQHIESMKALIANGDAYGALDAARLIVTRAPQTVLGNKGSTADAKVKRLAKRYLESEAGSVVSE